MKGISEIIATILMLMITLAISGTAYIFISGAFTQQTQGLELVDAFCINGVNATVLFRNIGTNPVQYSNGLCNDGSGPCGNVIVVRTSGGATMKVSGNVGTIQPAGSAMLIDGEDPVAGATGCAAAGTPATCIYRITPPAGRTIVASVNCGG